MAMTKAEMRRSLVDIAERHPVHALPLICGLLTELVARLPEDPAPRPAQQPHKRFVPIDVRIPGKESE